MKTIKALMILCMVCSYWAAFAVEEKPGPDAVVSKVLPQAMPHETTKRTEFLWDNFANKPDADQFSNYTSGNWTNNFAAFASNLVAKAKAQKQKSSRVLVSAFRGVGDHRSSIAGTIFYELQSCLVEGEHPNVHQMRIHTHH